MNNKKLLSLCLPTYNGVVHLNSKEDHTVLATDQLIVELEALGIEVTPCCLLDQFKCEKPLMQSKKKILAASDVKLGDYSVVWYNFRDPTPPEVMKSLMERKLLTLNDKKIINDPVSLALLFKRDYLKVLEKRGLAAKIVDRPWTEFKWSDSHYCTHVSLDKKYVRTYGFNNCRGNYPEWEKNSQVVTEYIDNERDGERTFFRVGYALGHVLPGFLYRCPADVLAPKSGSAKTSEPFTLGAHESKLLAECMAELGVDIAHVEGLQRDGSTYIFDLNPYFTAQGKTLTPITRGIAEVIAEELFK